MSSSLSTSDRQQQPTHTPVALIVFAWALVGIPLLYGLFRTVQTAITLFTG
ncbi:hypothetical protein OF117_12880 [Geodermatophilus sp. YIM 151500]|uniref:MFS transporter small subunit n=1 Tax=Geodermatophilus sp. YIM 151500 TaxID=2984531 RepID=UPI0021E3C703|nr:hypothetical protein [Geodermatophilus sp. YIM 151500]MCV2490259.1 hypothetical protein [Geodermatophilus sp. YIM 151500]